MDIPRPIGMDAQMKTQIIRTLGLLTLIPRSLATLQHDTTFEFTLGWTMAREGW